MKVISLGMGQIIFDKNSAVRQRQIEYGKYFDEYHLIIFTPDHDRFEYEKLSANVYLYPTKSKRRALYILDYLLIVKKIIENSKEDIIITAQDPFETGLVGLLLKLRFGLPLHIQIHTDFVNKFFIKHSPLNLVRLLMAQVIIPFADRVRVVSKIIKNSIQELTTNVDLLPIFVEAPVLEGSKIAHEKFTVLTIGRLESEKDLITAIKSFDLFVKNGADAEFVIVGDGSQMSKLKSLTKELNLESKIKFVGWQNDLRSYYLSADVYLSTSLYEGYGMTLIEAAYYGLPVVMTNTGLAGDIFVDESSALICEQKNCDEISLALTRIYMEKEFAKNLVIQALKNIEERSVTKEQYLNIYRQSIESARTNMIPATFLGRFLDLIFEAINHNKLLRYVIGGLSVALSQILLLYILTEFARLWYLLSSSISFVYAVIASYLVQKLWVFRDKSKDRALRQFFQFILVAILCICINTSSMYFWVDIFGIWYVLAQIITGFIIMFVNFTIYKFIIFKK